MADWKPMPDAPRGTPVRLFLPCVKYDLDENGRPSNVSHGECVGVWDVGLTHWVDQQTGMKVYPSQWTPL